MLQTLLRWEMDNQYCHHPEINPLYCTEINSLNFWILSTCLQTRRVILLANELQTASLSVLQWQSNKPQKIIYLETADAVIKRRRVMKSRKSFRRKYWDLFNSDKWSPSFHLWGRVETHPLALRMVPQAHTQVTVQVSGGVIDHLEETDGEASPLWQDARKQSNAMGLYRQPEGVQIKQTH